MVRVHYDSNNSGGNWWLSDDDWKALEAAGWTVAWVEDDEFYQQYGATERWLGALATKAHKDFPTFEEGVSEWERVTGQYAFEEGCPCCGQPHSFWAETIEDELVMALESGKENVEGIEMMEMTDADKRYAEMIEERLAHMVANIPDDIRHQVNKYGYQRVNGRDWIAIIVEEFGETTQAYLKQDYDEAIKEAYQAIACLVRLTIEIQREAEGLHETEADLYQRPQ